jgi:hypothetical protein
MKDNDMSADWADHKRDRADKRHKNQVASTKILADAGIEFESKDNGRHIIIRMPFRIDFWPSTGLWKTSQSEGRGVRELIKTIKQGAAQVAPITN